MNDVGGASNSNLALLGTMEGQQAFSVMDIASGHGLVVESDVSPPIGPHFTVDIGTFAWYKTGTLGGVSWLILLL